MQRLWLDVVLLLFCARKGNQSERLSPAVELRNQYIIIWREPQTFLSAGMEENGSHNVLNCKFQAKTLQKKYFLELQC